ncbi:protein O-mannosyl-transferase TMTC2-like isoform X2 [Dysidea avara]|uniref:protein O-mannosyl-transferase TMTC2-like isoform X2 n=1 Tax=Dysidea avara TaxID=196820 RepID=UPI003323D740
MKKVTCPYLKEGTLLYGEGQYPQAMDSFQKATTFLAAAHLNLGLTLSALGHVVEAEKVLKHCAVINSDGVKDPKAHMSSVTSCLFNLGNLYVENKRHKEAVLVLNEALQKKPRDYSTQGIHNLLVLLGKAYTFIGDLENAEHYYNNCD